ncbi:hypothetical protein FI667_g9000, partial [Globisporangium splendens]
MNARADERLEPQSSGTGSNNEMEPADEGEDVKASVEELMEQPEPVALKAKEEDECRVAEATVPQAEEEKSERPQLRITTSGIHAAKKLVSPNVKSSMQYRGFGIERGILELAKIPRKEWIQPQNLPLPIPPPKAAPIIHEFCRHWSALRLRPYSSDSVPRKVEVGQHQSLLKNYEPHFSAGEPTFPTKITMPTFLEPRVSVEDAHAFLVSIHLRFTLGMLVYCIGNNSNGLLLQKEVNRSIAYFCRGLFLVANNQVPARAISQYMVWVSADQRDPNVLVHILFPSLRILIGFEYFAVVNGACTAKNQRRSTSCSAAKPPSQHSAWLVKIVFEKLLHVADEQKEEKLRCDAVRLLRRMFVAQVYNQYHQSQDHQEQIALTYFAFFPSIAHFIADGKLLFSNGSSTGVMPNGGDALDNPFAEQCIDSAPVEVFQQLNDDMKSRIDDNRAHEFNPSVSLSPTGALMHYRRIVEERNEMQNRRHRRSILKSTTWERKDTKARVAKGDEKRQEISYDEVRVHACLALVQHMIEIFLVDELSMPDIEMNLKHRRISRQRDSVSNDGCNASGSNGSNSIGKDSGVNATAIRSSNPKLVSVGNSNSLGSSIASGSTRVPSNKSLPRNWGKNHTPAPRRISTSLGSEGKSGSGVTVGDSIQVGTNQNPDEEDPGDYDVHLKCLYRVIAGTALRSLRTAVDQFEWVIRIIEKPFDCNCGKINNPNESNAHAMESVTIDNAFAFLGSLTGLLFLLINRANTIETLCQDFDGDVEEDAGEDDEDIEDRDQHFLIDLFQYLETFLARFQRALFACRIADLPLIHDECRIQLLLPIAATGKSVVVRQHAARLLCKLLAVCYEQTGSFLLVERPILKVLCSVFFSSGQPVLPTESIREAIEEMRQYSFMEDKVTPAFQIQFKELVNGLITQIKVFEMWQVAVSSPEQLRDYEEIEEGLYRVYAEAACCKLECIKFTKQTALEEERGDLLFWEIEELVVAREFAEKASWMEQQISISEQLLVCLKEQKRYSEYLETLKYLERVIYQNAEAEALTGGYGAGHAFYRITYTGDCVSIHISKHGYIYKRSKFMSLGEFVIEMKAMLRAKYPMCEQVDVVPESKSLTGDDQPNVIFMRITSVEEVKMPERTSKPQNDPQCNPQSSNLLSHLHSEALLVIERREEIRCPIENSMDDIQKRCFVLQDEINKEIQGRTDLKTLTLVLKESVDTHVHGGTPEVIESFLASSARDQDAASGGDDGSPTQILPPLLDARGKVMSADESSQKRHCLVNLLVHFLKLCWQCLMISREAYRRASSQSSIISASAAPAIAISQLQSTGDPSSLTNSSTSSTLASVPAGGLTNFYGNSAKNVNLTNGFMATTQDDDCILSPLQLEFEKSFAPLVELIQTKISFPYQSASDVTQLLQQMQLKRVGFLTPSGQNASAPMAASSSNGTSFH